MEDLVPKFQHASQVLDRILSTKLNQEHNQVPLLRSSLEISLFNVKNHSRKRKVREFLADYANTDHVNTQATQKDGRDDDNTLEEFEETLVDIEQSPETTEALNNLDFVIDNLFKQVLKEHQVKGLQFMWDRVYKKRQGCLLAHSMGLGKTLQTIALLTTMFQQLKRYPSLKFPTGNRVLILAPLITLSNWANEFGKWAVKDAENVVGEVFNFAELGGHATTSERKRFLKYWYTRGGIMLMNYDQFRSLLCASKTTDKDEYFQMLVSPGADVVVLDEGHRIKNSTTAISNLINQIHTRSRICLTGYPLQNHLLEYYYMINFIAPGLLGSPESFKAYFSNYIEKCYSDSSDSTKLQASMKLYVLQLLTENVSHRRDDSILKKELPPKTEYVVRFKMSEVQLDGYKKLIQNGVQADSPLIGLLILRAICNHPKIFQSLLKKRQEKKRNEDLDKELRTEKEKEDDSIIDDDEIIDEIISIPVGAVDGATRHEQVDEDVVEDNEEDAFAKWLSTGFEWVIDYLDNSDIESWKCSGKMSFILDLAKDCIIVKEKLVIVSHSIGCLNYIEQLLTVFGIKLSRVDGATVPVERQSIIDTFNNDPSIDVMLLSAKAAAIGINLTAANRIVLVDQDWNPLYDEQSIGRIYRYGQKKPVFVYRLMTAVSIEERIFSQSVHKRSISRRVIDNKASLGVSKDDMKNYFIYPSSDLKLIEPDNVDEDIKKDFISFNILKQNANCITDFSTYDQNLDIVDKQTSWISIDSKEDRKRAKQEAIGLMNDWKMKNSFE